MCPFLEFTHDNILTGAFIVRRPGWQNLSGTIMLSLLWFLFWGAIGFFYLEKRFKRKRAQ